MSQTQIQTRSAPTLSNIPPEILEEIFIHSENLALQTVCRRLYNILIQNVVLLRFCTKIFYEGRSLNCTYMAGLQTMVLARKWFTLEFSEKVENAVLKLQDEAFNKMVVEKNLENDVAAWSAQFYEKQMVHCALNTYLPRHLLRRTWVNDSVNLLHRLMIWNAEANPRDVDAAQAGMWYAIHVGHRDAIELLLMLSIGLELDQEYYRRMILNGSWDRSIVKIFARENADTMGIDWGESSVMDEINSRIYQDENTAEWEWLYEHIMLNKDFSDDEEEFEFYKHK